MDHQELTRFIAGYQRRYGYPPTMRELAAEFAVNEKTIRNRLRKLAEEGRVTWRPGEHRTVTVRRPNMKAKSIPL